MACFDAPRIPAARGLHVTVGLLALAVTAWCSTARAADDLPTRAQAATLAATTPSAGWSEVEVSRSVVDSSDRTGSSTFVSNGFTTAGASNLSTHTMLWTGRSRVSFGIGVSERSFAAAGRAAQSPQAAETGLLVGLAFNGKHRTSFVWQSEPQAEGGTRMVFANRKPYDDLRRGALMKFQMDDQTTVSLRPRRGRVGLMLQRWWW